MTCPSDPDEVCPYCRGVDYPSVVGQDAAVYQLTYKEGRTKSTGMILTGDIVCAACMGDGKRSTAMARILSGDFVPRFPLPKDLTPPDSQ